MQIPTSVLSSNYDTSSLRRGGQQSAVSDFQADTKPMPDQAMAAEADGSVAESVSAPESSQFSPVASAPQAEAAANSNAFVPSEPFTSSGNSMTDQYLQVANETPMSMTSQDPSLFGVDEYV
ncbi:hypothetical protein [Reinekea marinisedimentorum]|uniref:Uncharacterized protein n=1 Tax=Reinekea marinisedimentorum TaxID=230495 RepID=A0A4V6NY35_9GAMM|nr:hypothetical protein [Reinekea marinisedimentorum]TCS41351.1 hypothetical protein BCF53_10682 [Reinekea marinisedimentorum]